MKVILGHQDMHLSIHGWEHLSTTFLYYIDYCHISVGYYTVTQTICTWIMHVRRNSHTNTLTGMHSTTSCTLQALPCGPTKPFLFKNLGSDRWLQTLCSISVCFIKLDRPELYMFRRMQLAEQAALKQARNPLQKTMIFNARAMALQDCPTNKILFVAQKRFEHIHCLFWWMNCMLGV